MERFTKQGLTLNLEKCKFGKPEVEFLGHKVSTSGAVPLTKHTEAIQSFHQPEDKKQLQRFLGMINFYRRFIPRATQLLLPLTNALCGSGTKIVWTAEMVTSFAKAKEAICTATCLVHPDPSADISLAVDASDVAVGGVLQQKEKNGWRLLSFFSKKLDSAQTKYSAFYRELQFLLSSVRTIVIPFHFGSGFESGSGMIISHPDPAGQKVPDPAGSGSTTLLSVVALWKHIPK